MLGFWGYMLYDIAHNMRLAGAEHVTMNLCAFRRGIVTKINTEALIDDYIIGIENRKKGYKFVYEPGAIVHVTFPTTVKDFLKQRVRTFAGYMQVRDWYGEQERSFKQEVKSAKSVFAYPKNFKEWAWLGLLFVLRAYAWARAYWVYKVKRKKLLEIWKPALSTKTIKAK